MTEPLHNFDHGVPRDPTLHVPARRLRRPAFFTLVGLITGSGAWAMYIVLSANGIGFLDIPILALFSVTFAWITTAFCSAVIGALLTAFGIDPMSLRRIAVRMEDRCPMASRTAVIMPVHNENVAQVTARLEATCRDLQRTGEAHAFDFFLLSDSTDDIIAAREERAVAEMRARTFTGHTRLFYRRRRNNQGRKAGNVADFCRRWGARYECMVVMDADSIMAGDTLCRLVRAMQATPSAGIIQTVPLPVGQRTVFGRALQFAASLYSPMLAHGLCFWQMESANYWGHNAIIRIAPFMKHCNLPVLPGRPPLGGEILSHDFVEAALMRRAGYHVLLVPEVGGSFEDVPGNILDFARRDRRWSQGNFQHLRLMNMKGLHPLSRLHFLFGALAYGCSFLWLSTLTVSSVDALTHALTEIEYFGADPTLFPMWPASRTAEIWWLLATVVTMLFLPKVLGMIAALSDHQRRREFGGSIRLAMSTLAEMILSVVIAPVMMCFHAYFVIAILMGQSVRWDPQNRGEHSVPWHVAARHTLLMTIAGIVCGAGLYAITPIYFWALTPVLLGLVLAAPLVVISSRAGLGRRLRHLGLFLTPQETRPLPVLADHLELSAQPATPVPRRRQAKPGRVPLALPSLDDLLPFIPPAAVAPATDSPHRRPQRTPD